MATAKVEKTEKPRARTRRAGADSHKTAPQKLKLLVTIVNRNKAEFYIDQLEQFEINLQCSFSGHGTAGSEILHLMGLEETEKRVICSLVREDMAPAAMAMLEEKFRTVKNGKGVAVTVPLTGVIGVSIYQFLCNNRRGQREGKLL